MRNILVILQYKKKIFQQVWLGRLSDEMKDTLKELLLECLRDAKQSKGGLDPNKYPSQVGIFRFDDCPSTEVHSPFVIERYFDLAFVKKQLVV